MINGYDDSQLLTIIQQFKTEKQHTMSDKIPEEVVTIINEAIPESKVDYKVGVKRIVELQRQTAKWAYQTFAAPLQAWKESAISVTPDMQAIGNAIGVRLGESIHDKILPAIESLKKQLEETQNAFNNNYNELMELAAHAKDLEKQLEEWKALAEAWEAYKIYNELKSQMIK
jgi:hypothetical protein